MEIGKITNITDNEVTIFTGSESPLKVAKTQLDFDPALGDRLIIKYEKSGNILIHKSGSAIQPIDTLPPKKAKSIKELWEILMAITGLGAIIFIIYIAYTVLSKPDSKEKILQRQQSEMLVRCEKVIKSQLNNPATYESSMFSDPPKFTPLGNNDYIIQIKFTAKNSFGVERRLVGSCEVSNNKIVDSNLLQL